jgi:hypothetical protein
MSRGSARPGAASVTMIGSATVEAPITVYTATATTASGKP